MSNSKYLTIFIFCSVFFNFAESKEADSPQFDYGYGETHFKWGAVISPPQGQVSDFELRVGTRLQALVESKQTRGLGGAREPLNEDFYIRRARLQVEAKFQKVFSYYMDIRADKVDRGNDGSNEFALGDAFLQVKNVFGSENLKLRLFRAKFDVSRSQTVSSSRLLLPHRASISDYASEYISKARRGTNVQLLGNWSNRLTTQFVVGDSIQESSFYDSRGSKKDVTLNNQSLAYGARVRVSPFFGWEDGKLRETQFGEGKHLTLGAGAFFVNNINYSVNGSDHELDRKLYNFDFSFHFYSFSLMSEYFVFEGVVDSFQSNPFQIGKSEGWVVQFEYVLTNFHYLAPYFRYQSWDRFKERSDFDQNSWLVGLNYYLKGNKLRIGGFLENTNYGDQLTALGGFADSQTLIGLNLMMHY